MRPKQIALALMLASLATTAAAQSAPKQKSPAHGKKETRYCIEFERMTGSRLKDSECLTRAEWSKRGVDIDQVLKP